MKVEGPVGKDREEEGWDEGQEEGRDEGGREGRRVA